MASISLVQIGDKFTISPKLCNDGAYPCPNAAVSFSIPGDLDLVSIDTGGVGAYDQVNNVWRIGNLPAPSSDPNFCYPISLEFQITDDANVPLTITATGTSACVEDPADNVQTWTVTVNGCDATGDNVALE